MNVVPHQNDDQMPPDEGSTVVDVSVASQPPEITTIPAPSVVDEDRWDDRDELFPVIHNLYQTIPENERKTRGEILGLRRSEALLLPERIRLRRQELDREYEQSLEGARRDVEGERRDREALQVQTMRLSNDNAYLRQQLDDVKKTTSVKVVPEVTEKVPQNRPAATYVAEMERLDSTLSSEREKEREAEFAKSLETVRGGLDVERQTNQSLRERLAAEEVARAALQARIAHQESPSVIDAPRVSNWQTAQRWLVVIASVVVVLAVLTFIILVGYRLYGYLADKAEVAIESESSQPSENIIDDVSRRRSTPTTKEVDDDWEVQRMRKLIDRNRNLSQGEAK